MLEQMISNVLVWIIPAFLVATLREAFRNQVINLMGDTVPKAEGTLNWRLNSHIDPMGTFAVPIIMSLSSGLPLAWGRKTPISPRHYRGNPKRGAIIVAFSGSAFNVLLALIVFMLAPYAANIVPDMMQQWVFSNLRNFILLNCVMAIFHLLPVLPLDGGWIVSALLPDRLAQKYRRHEDYGVFILVLIFMILPAMQQYIRVSIPLDQYILWQPAFELYKMIETLAV